MQPLNNDTDLIKAIEAWFTAQCDGDWEHSFGLSIETIDNPGWSVEVDLMDTAWADVVLPFSRDERSDSDWIQSAVTNGKFIGSGGTCNLNEILRRFLSIVSESP